MNQTTNSLVLSSAEPAQSRNLGLGKINGFQGEGSQGPEAMQIEEVKGYISNSIEILSKCLRTAFQGIRQEIDQITDLGTKLENGLNHTMNKVEEQDLSLSNHETMLKNIINAARWMFDNQIKKNLENDQTLTKLSQDCEHLRDYIEPLNVSVDKLMIQNNQIVIDS